MSAFLAIAIAGQAAIAPEPFSHHPDSTQPGLYDTLGGRHLFNVLLHQEPPVVVGDSFLGAEVLGVNEALSFITVATDDREGFEAAAKENQLVRSVEGDSLYAVRPLQIMPDDSLYIDQWGLHDHPGIDAAGAWDVTLGDRSVKVAVLDSGIEMSHEDLDGVIASNADCTGIAMCVEGASVDACEHGTHVAGTIAALTNNGIGVAGVAQVSLIDVKVLAAPPMVCYGTFEGVASGIVWATDQGADIISMSLGGGFSSVVEAALEYASDNGVLVIAAAGNSGCPDTGSSVLHPASSKLVIAVANHRSSGERGPLSSCGPEVEISAPGTDVLSACWASTYCMKSGTSMATPHVSGAAALLMSHEPALSAQEVRERLKDTAVKFGTPEREQGAGALNACLLLGGAAACAPYPDVSGPQARFVYECDGLACAFDASSSSGAIVDYHWDFGDGETTSTDTPTAEHSYEEPASRVVTLVVVDEDQRTDTTRRSVNTLGTGALYLTTEGWPDPPQFTGTHLSDKAPSGEESQRIYPLLNTPVATTVNYFYFESATTMELEGDLDVSIYVSCDAASVAFPLPFSVSVRIENNGEPVGSTTGGPGWICVAGNVILTEVTIENMDAVFEPGDLLALSVGLWATNTGPYLDDLHMLVGSTVHPSRVEGPGLPGPPLDEAT